MTTDATFTTLVEASREFVRGRRARGEIAEATATSYADSLRLFERHVGADRPLREIERADVESWVEAQFAEGLRPKTVYVRLTALSSFFDWCLERELVDRDPARHVRRPTLPDEEPRALTSSQVAAALRACRTDRERVMILLECQEMLRRGEVARLRLRDLNPERRCVLVHGKGGKQRTVPLSEQTWTMIQRLHPRWIPAAHVVESEAVGALSGTGITPKRLGELVSDVLHRAGVDESGHALRHTGATDALDNGATIEEVQALLGHSTIATTQRYTGRRNLEKLRVAAGGRIYGPLGPSAA